MLLGDAACFADPLLSQGVHLATYAGLLAARSVNGCLEGDVDETTSFGEYERRYRREFGLFYEYLIYLYDMNHNQDSYYWKARSLLKTEERANDAFVALVAGLSASDPSLGTGNEFFRKREGIGDIFQAAVSGEDTSAQNQTFDIDAVFGSIFLESDQLQKLVRQGHLQAAQPMFDNGLVPSIDGLKWVTPAVQAS
jgi:halogenation protein CepH